MWCQWLERSKEQTGSGKAEPPRPFRKFWFFSERSHTVSILRETGWTDTSCNSCLLMFLLNKLFLSLLSGWGALNLWFTPQQSGNISALHSKENRAKENVQSVKGRHYIKTVIKMFLSFDGMIYISLHIHIYIYAYIHVRFIYTLCNSLKYLGRQLIYLSYRCIHGMGYTHIPYTLYNTIHIQHHTYVS